MSKELWIQAHDKAIEEAQEANPGMTWTDAYNSTSARADEIYRERCADMIDEARMRAKDL
jgi:hypothetical protein